MITVLDSSGNLVREIRQNDTVRTSRGEICVWERGPLGYPYLRCYPRYYPREWYSYNKSPWWYRSDEHLYSADRCPPYYYFDETCECCRYYLHNPSLNSGNAIAPAAAAPPTTGRVTARSPDTNVRVSATTYYGQRVSPKSLFQNSGSTVTPAGTSNTASGVSQQKTDSLALSSGSAVATTQPVDSTNPSHGTDSVRQVTATDTPARPAPPPPQPPLVRERRTMRSW